MTKATRLVVGAAVLAGTMTAGGLQASAANHEVATPANNVQRVHQLTIDERIEADPAVQIAKHNVAVAEKAVQAAMNDQKNQHLSQQAVEQELAKAQGNLAMRQRAGQHMHTLSVEANARQAAAKTDSAKKTAHLTQLQSESVRQRTKSDLEQAQTDVETAKTELENAEIEVSGSAIDDRYAQAELKTAQVAVVKAQAAVNQQLPLSKVATDALVQAQQHLTTSQAQLTMARNQARAVLTQQGTTEHQGQATATKPNQGKLVAAESTANNVGPAKAVTHSQAAKPNSVVQSQGSHNSSTTKPAVNSVSSANAPLKAKTLPQTDETTDIAFSMLGMFLLGLTGWLGLKQRNHKRMAE